MMNKTKLKEEFLMQQLSKYPRINLSSLARKLDMPRSTLWDYIKRIENQYYFFGVFFNRTDTSPVKLRFLGDKSKTYPKMGLNSYEMSMCVKLLDKSNTVQRIILAKYLENRM